MKTVIVSVAGELNVGEYIGLCYTDPRGGGNSVIGFRVPEPRDRIETAADGSKSVVTSKTEIKDLIQFWKNEIDAGKSWIQNEIQASVRNDRELVIKCSDNLQYAEFFASIEGVGPVITIEQL